MLRSSHFEEHIWKAASEHDFSLRFSQIISPPTFSKHSCFRKFLVLNKIFWTLKTRNCAWKTRSFYFNLWKKFFSYFKVSNNSTVRTIYFVPPYADCFGHSTLHHYYFHSRFLPVQLLYLYCYSMPRSTVFLCFYM